MSLQLYRSNDANWGAEDVGDFFEPIRALRVWTLSPSTYGLFSVYTRTHWPHNGALEAECHQDSWNELNCPLPAPNHLCGCGIYGIKHLDAVSQVVDYFMARSNKKRNLVVGSIEMWGRMLEGKLGYRSQYARPLALARLNRSSGAPLSDVLNVANRYKISFVRSEDLLEGVLPAHQMTPPLPA